MHYTAGSLAVLFFLLLFFVFSKFGKSANVPEAEDEVVIASRILEMSVYDVFCLAYSVEHNITFTVYVKGKMTQNFYDFLSASQVPPWLAKFCKRVLAEHEQGTLDQEKYRRVLYA